MYTFGLQSSKIAYLNDYDKTNLRDTVNDMQVLTFDYRKNKYYYVLTYKSTINNQVKINILIQLTQHNIK